MGFAEKTIDGYTYKMAPLSPWDQTALLIRLAVVAGPALVTAIKGAIPTLREKKKLDQELLFAALLPALDQLPEALAKLGPGEFERIAKQLLSQCRVSGTRGEEEMLLPLIPSLLAGKPYQLIQLVGWALEVNYFPFASGSASPGLDKLGPPAPKPSGSSSAASTPSTTGPFSG